MPRPLARLVWLVLALLGFSWHAAVAAKYEARPPVKVVVGKTITKPKVVLEVRNRRR